MMFYMMMRTVFLPSLLSHFLSSRSFSNHVPSFFVLGRLAIIRKYVVFWVEARPHDESHEGAGGAGVKFLYALDEEASQYVLDYQIHLAPSSDFDARKSKRNGHNSRDTEEEEDSRTNIQNNKERIDLNDHHRDRQYDGDDMSHVQPRFLTASSWNGPRVVEFYSPWCGHCREFKGRYVDLAREVNKRLVVTIPQQQDGGRRALLDGGKKGYDVDKDWGDQQEERNDDHHHHRHRRKYEREHGVTFHAISCSEYHDICKNNGVTGYPTVVAYKEGSGEGIKLTRFTPEIIANAVGVVLMDNKNKKNGRENEGGLSVDGGGKTTKPRGVGASAGGNAATASGGERHVDILGASVDNWKRTRKDTYLDAALSLTHALRYFIHLEKNIAGDDGSGSRDGDRRLDAVTMPALRKSAFVEFLDLLYWTLPPTWKVHTLINDLRQHVDVIVRGRSEMLRFVDLHHDVVHEHFLQQGSVGGGSAPGVQGVHADADDVDVDALRHPQWTKSCNHGKNGLDIGYMCGLWNLLHIVSVGVAERHDAVLGGLERVSTAHAARTLRGFVAHFFSNPGVTVLEDGTETTTLSSPCPGCADRFLSVYDSCGFDICNRMKPNPLSESEKRKSKWVSSVIKKRNARNSKAAEERMWRGLAIWLWQVHNDINVHVLREEFSKSRRVPSREEEDAVRWPSVEACPACWSAEQYQHQDIGGMDTKTVWDEGAIYRHLKKEYWPGGVQNFRFVVLDKKEPISGEDGRGQYGYYNYDLDWKSVLRILLPRATIATMLVSYSVWYMNKARLARSGRHKKIESDTQ